MHINSTSLRVWPLTYAQSGRSMALYAIGSVRSTTYVGAYPP